MFNIAVANHVAMRIAIAIDCAFELMRNTQ